MKEHAAQKCLQPQEKGDDMACHVRPAFVTHRTRTILSGLLWIGTSLLSHPAAAQMASRNASHSQATRSPATERDSHVHSVPVNVTGKWHGNLSAPGDDSAAKK